MLLRRAALLGALLLAGCPKPKPLCLGDVGDPKQPLELVAQFASTGAGTGTDLKGGEKVRFVSAPQGGGTGLALFFAVKARNLRGCKVHQTAQLRDPETGITAGFDGRDVDLSAGADGWGRPDYSDGSELANVVPCPDFTKVDVQGHTWNLELTVTDADKRTTSVTVPVVPDCGEGWESCLATCSAQGADGGAPDAGSADAGP